jgi:glycosyltransferase involved in cell wall biosynthesis
VPRTLVVTNLATHYRRPLYRRLAELLDLHLVFYSDGGEWYWQGDDGGVEDLPATRLKGKWVGHTRITPGLLGVMLLRPYDVCIGSLNGKFALPVSYLGARLRRKGFVLWTGMWRHPTTRVHRLTRRPTRFLYRHADVVLTYGRHVSRFVVAEGADPARVIEAPQAVDLELFSLGGRDLGLAVPLRIGFVGRLEHWKGPQVLIEALGSLASCQMAFSATFVGAGPDEAACRERVQQLGLADRVTFVGRVPNAELPDLYRELDVVVVPSVETADFSEPWSLAVNEAMGCGCLVIASDSVGAAADGLVTDGATGRVVPSGDADALAAVLRETATRPELTRELRAAGNRRVQAYSFDAAAAAFVEAAALSARTRGRRRPQG